MNRYETTSAPVRVSLMITAFAIFGFGCDAQKAEIEANVGNVANHIRHNPLKITNFDPATFEPICYGYAKKPHQTKGCTQWHIRVDYRFRDNLGNTWTQEDNIFEHSKCESTMNIPNVLGPISFSEPPTIECNHAFSGPLPSKRSEDVAALVELSTLAKQLNAEPDSIGAGGYSQCSETCPSPGRVLFQSDGFSVCRCLATNSVSYRFIEVKDSPISATLVMNKWLGLKKGQQVKGGKLKRDLYAVEAAIELHNASENRIEFDSPIHLIGPLDQPIMKNIHLRPVFHDSDKKVRQGGSIAAYSTISITVMSEFSAYKNYEDAYIASKEWRVKIPAIDRAEVRFLNVKNKD